MTIAAAPNPSLVWSPHPILAAQDRRLIYTPWTEGETIARYLGRVGIDPDIPAVLAVDGQIVPRHLWPIAKPKPGTLITLRAVAEGGDDSNPLAAVAMIALAIFAPGLGNALAGAFGISGTAIAFAGVTYGTLFAGAITLVGGMVINSLFSPPTAQLSQGRAPEVSPTYSLTGGQNQARPYGPLPLVLGKHRMFPDLASKPYTEFAGDEQYLIQLFNFGYGSLRITDLRIGQTPLSSYSEIVTEQSNYDGILYKFPGNVDSLSGGVLGSGTPPVAYPNPTNDTAYVTRTSSDNTIRMAIDLEATIYRIDSEGMGEWFVTVWAFYRPVGGAWVAFPGFTDPTGGRYIANADTKPLRMTFYTDVLSPGQYEVRIKRALGEGDPWENTQVTDAMVWATLRSYQLDTAATYENQIRFGIWIRASGQISGVMQRLSALVENSCYTWDGAQWVWDYTSNPAWWFLYFVRGWRSASNGGMLFGCGLTDDRIDVEAIKLWGAYCNAHGLTCNMIVDRPMSAAEVLNAIARCGRASITWATGKLGVTWDDSEAPVVAQFGMSSIAAGTFEITWASAQLADEIVVQFADEDQDYEQSEVRVLAPGTTVPELSQTMQWMGCTSQSMAGKCANLLMASNVYRSRKITWETDAEGLIVTRGDRIMLSHDLTQWGYSGRLTAATTTRLDFDRAVPRTAGTAAWVALVAPDGSETYHALTDVATAEYSYVTLSVALAAGSVPGTAFPNSKLFDWKWRFDFTATPGKRVKIAAIEPLSERRVRITAVDDPVEYHGMSVLGYTYIARLPVQPATPTVSGLVLTEVMIVSNGTITTQVIATWNTSGEVGVTRVRWHGPDGVWVAIGDVAGRRVQWSVPEAVMITVEVSVLNGIGQLGPAGVTTGTHFVVGKTDPPPPAEYFTVAGQADGTREFGFGYVVTTRPADLAGWRLRYVSGPSGTWDSMSALHAGTLTSSPYESNALTAGTWTFAVKSVDTSGNESTAALYATAVLLDPRLGGVIYQADAKVAGWPGTKTGCWIDPNTGYLEANSTDTWATIGTWASWTQWTSNPVTSWLYEHPKIDIGAVVAFTPGASCIGIGSFLVEEQHSNDDTVYSAWATAGAKITSRFVRLRVTVTQSAPGQATRLEQMRIMFDAQTIEEWLNDRNTSSWTGTTGVRRVPIAKTYTLIQQVSLTLQSVGSGWSWVLLDKDVALGPRIAIYNGSTPADANVDVYVKGL